MALFRPMINDNTMPESVHATLNYRRHQTVSTCIVFRLVSIHRFSYGQGRREIPPLASPCLPFKLPYVNTVTAVTDRLQTVKRQS